MTAPLRVAARATELALRRARWVQELLAAQHVDTILSTFRTDGDKHFEAPAHPASDRGLFTRELDQALLRRRVDAAVHACADVPTDLPAGLAIGAVLPREDPRDALVLNDVIEAASLDDLPRGTTIGTSSVRARGLLGALYPDLEVVHLRGDLPARLRKVTEGQVHATIAPAAALRRLEVSQHIAAHLEPPRWLPAPAQGVLVILVRHDDDDTQARLAPLHDARTAADVAAERAVLASLEGGLQSPVGALVLAADGRRVLHGVIVDPQGKQIVRAEHALGEAGASPELAGVRLANDLRGRGASRILDTLRRLERLPTPQPDSV